MICKGCRKEIDDPKPLRVLEGVTQQEAYFHGKDCWNLYKGCGDGLIDMKYPHLGPHTVTVQPVKQINNDTKGT